MPHRKLFLWALLACCFLLPASTWAQTTSVSGTVTDPNGVPYAGGTVVMNCVGGCSTVTITSQAQCTAAGAGSAPCNLPFPGTVGPARLDATGSFTITLYSNTSINPGGSQWAFTVGLSPGILPPLGTGPQSYTVNITVTGATQSVSSTLTAAAPSLIVAGFSPGGSTAFNKITSGTNTTAAMVVSTGASLAPSGSGSVTSNFLTPAGTSGDCMDWGASGAPADAGAACNSFPALTGGTNSTATMVIGTGASLGVSGTGTNTATACSPAGVVGNAIVWGAGGTCADFGAAPLVSQNVIYATAFGVKADAHQVWDCGWTNSSSTVACTAGDVNFTTQAHVGDIIWGVQTGNVFASVGTLLVPQGTISTITDSQHVVVSTTSTGACTSGGGTSCIFTWGTHDDTTAWTNFWNAVVASQCTPGVAPSGYSIVQGGLFNTNASNPGLCFTAQGNEFTGPSLIGTGGFGGTVLLPSPNFSAASCTGGTTGAACFFGSDAIHLTTMYIWGSGIGNIGAGFNGKFAAELTGGAAQANPYAQDVVISGWGGNTAGFGGLVMDEASEVYVKNVTINAAGSQACFIETLNANSFVNAFQLECVSGSANPCGLKLDIAGYVNSYGGQYGNCNASSTTGMLLEGGTFNSFGDQIGFYGSSAYTGGTITGGFSLGANLTKSTFNGNGSFLLNQTNNGFNLSLAGTTGSQFNLQNVTILTTGTAGTALKGGAGDTDVLNDLGGNKITTVSAGTLTSGQVKGPNLITSRCSGTATSSTTLFLQNMLGATGVPNCTNTTASVVFVSPSAGNILGLYVTATAGGVSASSGVVTVFKNGSSTAVTCTVGTATSCSFNAGASPVTVAQGDLITIQYTTQATETLAGLSANVWVQR